MIYTQPKGQILIFAPAFSGKTYLAGAYKGLGLASYDLEKEGPYIRWVNDKTKLPIKNPPKKKTERWLSSNHFLMDKKKVKKFLSNHEDCLVFAHSWNIMECLDLFTKSFYLYLTPKELERRMRTNRPDHPIPTQAKINFIKKKHEHRLKDVKKAGIPILDAARSPEEIYQEIKKNNFMHTCDAVTITCIDFRFQKFLEDWLHENIGINNYDRVALAGGVFNFDEIAKQAEVSHRLHAIKKVILINHEDCGAYGKEGTKEKHIADLTNAAAKLSEKLPSLKIATYYLHLDGAMEIV